MSKQTTNLVKRRKTKQALNPPITVKSIVTQFRRHPAYALSRLKRASDQQLTACALALGKRYKAGGDDEEAKEAMKTLVTYIWNLVAERQKANGNTDASR